jgi:HD-like signal output (HDOD) protein
MADTDSSARALQVLFVDDDPLVLLGLRRMLRSERNQWVTQFATRGSEALALLDDFDFDVVLSDMQMPDMDGAELLTRVRERRPAAVRIVLSGQSERSSAVKAASVAHQFLSKPTDARALRNAVSRARDLEDRLDQARLRSALGALDVLPSPSATVRSLNAAFADPSSDLDLIARIVEPDLAMSSKILQLVNSAFFALPREVSSLHEAVAYLGLENLRAVATSADMFQALQSGPSAEQLAWRLQAHSQGVVRLANHILPRATRPGDLFLGALLHDIGLLAAAALVPDLWADLVTGTSGPWTGQDEERVLGATHSDIGAYLLCLWGMPYGAVEVVARHHDPGPLEAGALAEVHAVYLAEALFAEADEVPGHFGPLDERHAAELGVLNRVDDWRRYRDTLLGGANERHS